MRLSLPKQYTGKIVKAIAEFNLIEDGDNILVGLSGGKDSAFLLYALAALKGHLSVQFNLTAVTVDLGFSENDLLPLREYCRKLGVPFHIKKTEIARYILKHTDGSSPCARCAHLRRGALGEFMEEHNFKKIAFGHHYDDAIITFLMSIIYSGQITALQPKRFLSRKKLYIIRPLIYLREKRIISAGDMIGYSPPTSPCPYDGATTRTRLENEFRELISQKQLFYNLAAAMREGAPLELWPRELTEEELTSRVTRLWGKGDI